MDVDALLARIGWQVGRVVSGRLTQAQLAALLDRINVQVRACVGQGASGSASGRYGWAGAAAGLAPAQQGLMPTAETTGCRIPSLTPAGKIIVDTDGARVSGIDGSQIVVRANGVTIEDVRLTYTGTAHAIQTDAGYTGLTVRYATVVLPGTPTGDTSNSGIQTRDGSLVEWCNVSGAGDGMKLWNDSEYRFNFVRMKRPAGSDKHLDGLQASGRTRFWVHHNDVEALIADGGNSAIFMQAYTGTVDVPVVDVLVEDNRLNGGNYTVFTEDGKTGTGFIQNMTVRNNVLGEDHRYDYRHLEGDITWTGNRDLEGALIP